MRKSRLGDAPGGLAAFEERLALSRDLADARKETPRRKPISWSASTRSLRSRWPTPRKEDAVIDEGLKILARLDADGKLSDDQKGWSESFLTLRNGSQEAGAANR